jgi:hypothetical protein
MSLYNTLSYGLGICPHNEYAASWVPSVAMLRGGGNLKKWDLVEGN